MVAWHEYEYLLRGNFNLQAGTNQPARESTHLIKSAGEVGTRSQSTQPNDGAASKHSS